MNYGLWVMVMGQCRFINYNKWTTLVGDLEMREAVHVWGQRTYRKDLPYFAVNLKPLKN